MQSLTPQANAFESSTGGVEEMVKGLGDKFELEKEEMEKEPAYQMMVSDLADQIENAKTSRDEKTSTKAAREQAAGEARGDLVDTDNTMKEDEKFLSDLNVECEQK